MKFLIVTICILLMAFSSLAKSDITCEGDSVTMECKGSKVIMMYSASWGRSNEFWCGGVDIPSGGCNYDALQRLSTRCNGKKKCTVEASNESFGGDPCPGVYKFMDTDHYCVPGGTVDICEGDSVEIKCPRNFLINVGNAFYGRQSSDVCANVAAPLLGCDAPEAKMNVAELCNGKSSCKISASNDFFGDPCLGTPKYAQVSYICPWVSTLYVCQDSTKVLSCPPGKTLRIFQTQYGRMQREICTHHDVPPRWCYTNEAYDIVKKDCHKKNSCTLEANNDVFGNPCSGVPKYLSVDYKCK